MLTAAQLASALGISERQVYRLGSEGMPSVPIGARGRRYDLEECRNWLRESYPCLSRERRPVAGRSASASTISEFTDACRRVHLRVKPSVSKPNCEAPSAEVERRLSLVTQD